VKRNSGEQAMTDEGNIIDLAIRLRDGRAVITAEDHQQWIYEYLDRFSRDIGTDHVPAEVFPVWVRVMVEWAEQVRGLDAEQDLETARALADAVRDLTDCLKKCLTQDTEVN
jgi:hypothetical protein